MWDAVPEGSGPARRVASEHPTSASGAPDAAWAEIAALHSFVAAMHRWRVSFAAKHALTMNDTVVLTTLVAGGDQVTAASLARSVDVSSGRLTGSLDRLEAAGLARREPNPDDRRSVLVAVTDAGRRATATLDGALRSVVSASVDSEFRERFTARMYHLSGAADRSRNEIETTG